MRKRGGSASSSLPCLCSFARNRGPRWELGQGPCTAPGATEGVCDVRRDTRIWEEREAGELQTRTRVLDVVSVNVAEAAEARAVLVIAIEAAAAHGFQGARFQP